MTENRLNSGEAQKDDIVASSRRIPHHAKLSVARRSKRVSPLFELERAQKKALTKHIETLAIILNNFPKCRTSDAKRLAPSCMTMRLVMMEYLGWSLYGRHDGKLTRGLVDLFRSAVRKMRRQAGARNVSRQMRRYLENDERRQRLLQVLCKDGPEAFITEARIERVDVALRYGQTT